MFPFHSAADTELIISCYYDDQIKHHKVISSQHIIIYNSIIIFAHKPCSCLAVHECGVLTQVFTQM